MPSTTTTPSKLATRLALTTATGSPLSPTIASPFQLPCGLTLKNRIVKAAMSEGMANDDGVATPALARLYGRWAEGGAGLLLTGNFVVCRAHPERSRNVLVEDDRAYDGIQAMADAAHKNGAAIIAQLSHAGRQTSRFVNPAPLAPSAVAAVKTLRAFAPSRAMTVAQIEDVRARFVRAARIVHSAGFDGVELHAAHGYLLSQFLSPFTNRRDDAWGGSLENRARLLLEIVRGVRAATSPQFAVCVKLNSADFQRGGFDEGDAVEVVKMLEREGVDLLEISGGTYERFTAFGSAGEPSAREAYFVPFAEKLRASSKIPVMLTGGFRSRAAMDAAIADGTIDFVGLARSLAIEPDFPRKLLADGDAVAMPPPRPFPFRALANAAEVSYYTRQLVRMGRGDEPEADLSQAWSLVIRLWEDATYSRRSRAAAGALPRAAEA